MRPPETIDDSCCARGDDETERVVHEAERISHPPSLRTAAVDTFAGMAAGAMAGVVAGPPGLLAGFLLGGAAGAVAGLVAEREEHERTHHDDELDTDIGVFGGRIGEAARGQPAPQIGALSRASTGAGAAPEDLFEEPFLNID